MTIRRVSRILDRVRRRRTAVGVGVPTGEAAQPLHDVLADRADVHLRARRRAAEVGVIEAVDHRAMYLTVAGVALSSALYYHAVHGRLPVTGPAR